MDQILINQMILVINSVVLLVNILVIIDGDAPENKIPK